MQASVQVLTPDIGADNTQAPESLFLQDTQL